MNWKKLAWSAVFSTGLVFGIGCGDDDSPGTDGGTGSDTALPPEPLSCGDCFYVVDTLGIPEEDPAGVVRGFNLDGRISDETDAESCFQLDFTHPDGTPGIDNQLAALAPSLVALAGDLDAQIAEALADGTIIVLVELEGVETTADSNVTVNLYLGQTVDGNPPMLTGGRPAPGQTFNIDADSVDAGGNPIITVGGARTQGRVVRAGPLANFPIVIPFDGATNLELNIRSAQLQATINADNTLSAGMIGGGLDIDELAALGEGLGVGADTVRTLLSGLADLNHDPATGDCGAISVGIDFTAVAATKGTVVSD
ncbi:MAG: hypothetical protein KF901_15350 [Myxococcales bacterium]|nr:hypothetical protein [Myxococcales bacterium]